MWMNLENIKLSRGIRQKTVVCCHLQRIPRRAKSTEKEMNGCQGEMERGLEFLLRVMKMFWN
jgi:hypothetical protein